LFDHALAGELDHFGVHMDRLPAAADLVCQVIRDNYPSLQVPPHARWRHFVLDGVDRWTPVASLLKGDTMERVRAECELAIISVLLDAGAGPHWGYKDAQSGKVYTRSEGLALASLDMYVARAFAPDRLAKFDATALSDGFQVSQDNPLEGLECHIRRFLRVEGLAP
jgi:hypothetical protein